MRIEIRTQGFAATPALSAHAEREVVRALARLRPRPRDVVVLLSDLNGPRGGEDKVCRLRARFGRVGQAFASAANADLYEAIGKAARRLGHTLFRAAGRRRDRRAASGKLETLVEG